MNAWIYEMVWRSATNLCLLALKGTSMYINPSVVIGLLSNSYVTQSFMLVPRTLPREKKNVGHTISV